MNTIYGEERPVDKHGARAGCGWEPQPGLETQFSHGVLDAISEPGEYLTQTTSWLECNKQK